MCICVCERGYVRRTCYVRVDLGARECMSVQPVPWVRYESAIGMGPWNIRHYTTAVIILFRAEYFTIYCVSHCSSSVELNNFFLKTKISF